MGGGGGQGEGEAVMYSLGNERKGWYQSGFEDCLRWKGAMGVTATRKSSAEQSHDTGRSS